MADFKRFLSYIYAYDGDLKMNGTGFAKLEVRDGRYRLTVNLNCALPAQGKNYHVAVFGGNNDKPEIADIGVLEQHGNSFVLREAGIVWSFAGGRLSIEDAKGLVIFKEAGSRIHVTSWVDPQIPIQSIRECIYKLKNPKHKEEIADSNVKNDAETVAGSVVTEKETVLNAASIENAADLSTKNTKNQEKTEELSTKTSENQQKTPENQEKTEELSTKTSENQQKGRELSTKTPENQQKGRELSTKTPENINTESVSKLGYKDIIIIDTKKEEEPLEVNINETPDEELMETEADNNSYSSEGADLWHEFKRMYPKMRPFNDEGWEVLQIKLQDIGRLKRENWILGNNNFVLHGFYKYGYLILARKHKPDMDVYILGVPGTFSINEKFIASLFGMTEFMESGNKRADLPKNFGYWCTHINM